MATGVVVNDAPNAAGVLQGLNLYHRRYSKDIYHEIRCKLKAEKYMRTRMMILDEDTITLSETKDLMKRFDCKFEPAECVNFTPRILKVRHIKIDKELCCLQTLHTTYMGDMFDLGEDSGKVNRFQRFIKWIFQNNLQDKIAEELEIASVRGWYESNPTTPTYLNMLDGIGTIAERMANNGTAQVIPTGALTPGTAQDKIEAFLKAIPKKYRTGNTKGILWVSEQVACRFYFDRRADQGNNMDYQQLKAAGLIDDFTQIEIVDFEGLDGSDFMFYTPKWNVTKMYNRHDVLKGGGWETDKQDRCIHIMKDFKRGYDFLDPRYVWTNDQALHGPTNI